MRRPKQEDDLEWLEKSLACVSWDGRVDAEALGAVEFAHDFGKARQVVAAERAVGIPRKTCFGLGGLLRTSSTYTPYYLYVTLDPLAHAWVAEPRPGDSRWTLGADDVVAALAALSASARRSAFRFEPHTGKRDRLLDADDAWLVRVSEALAVRSTAWDLAAIDRELALARALGDLLIARRLPTREDGRDPPRVSVARLRGHGDEVVEAYETATRLCVDRGLVLNSDVCVCPARDGAEKALRIFVTGIERLQATPAIYLGAIAPAIAARIQDDFDARHRTDDDLPP